MEPIELSLPRSVRVVFNMLYPDNQIKHLTHDIILLQLPEDIEIDVGWYPPGDPTGSYKIRAYQHGRGEVHPTPIRETDPFRVAEHIHRLVNRLSGYTSFAVWSDSPDIERYYAASASNTSEDPTYA